MVVSEKLQEEFAALSGDRNPMHMNEAAARRTQAGKPVVHGVHTLLWALDSLAGSGSVVSPLLRVKVKFLKWVYLGDELVVALPGPSQTNPRALTIEVLDMPVLSAEIVYGESSFSESNMPLVPSPAAPLRTALDLTFTELRNRSGQAFTADEENIQHFFPHLSAVAGAAAVTEIAACSYIVGMEAPGLHSMFSKVDLTFFKPQPFPPPRSALFYAVVDVDERFRKTKIAVTGKGITGMLDAFIRVPPVEQASVQTIAACAQSLEFAGMSALIIGGSRGLGEVTAKIITAGGGKSTITYATGKGEADRVANQIRDWGGDIRVLPYDVRDHPKRQLAGLEGPITHLFYFATNAIFRQKKNLVSREILSEFITFYVQGFHDICLELTKAKDSAVLRGDKLIVYYPSSVAVEERPAGMTEYAMAKAAGEQLCRDMNQYLPDLHILTTRLPRLLTDQTAGIIPVRELDPIHVLLPIVREMQHLLKSS